MQRKLPFLPGNSFDDHLLRENHAKKQVFNYRNNQAVINDTYAPQEPQELPESTRLLTQKLGSTTLDASMGVGSESETDSSKWLSLDRKVLRFYCYFREGVVESANENSRVRRCVLYYYLEDDTIHVSEPRQDNSGIPQGSLIKRHRIPKPDDPNVFYSIEDLNIGEEVTLYGKTFRIVDCDKFTRDFLEMVGVPVSTPEDYPQDQYTTQRNKLKESMSARIQMTEQDREFKRFMEYTSKGRHCKPSKVEQSAAQQFLKNDRKVLQFYACWDNRVNLYGDFRKFSITYFLSNNQIKIAEILPSNSGRDPFPVFVKKQTITNPTTGRIYTPEDLGIGKKIHVFGRDLLVYDIDSYTQQYYKKNYGQTDFTPIEVEGQKKQKSTVSPPPYNGYGTEEDSLGSWKYLVLKPPKKDIAKYMQFDKVALRFMSQLVTDAPEDRERRFLICFHLADDTLSIFEPPQRNSGIVGGKFLQRCRCKNNDTGKWFEAADFHVGATVRVNNYVFKLLETDDRTLSYMESDPTFDKADISSVIVNIRSRAERNGTRVREAFNRLDREGTGEVSLDELRDLLIGERLTENEQEVITVLRNLPKTSENNVKYSDLLLQLTPQAPQESLNASSTIKVSTFNEESTRVQDTRLRKQFDQIKSNVFDDFKQEVKNRRLLFVDTFRVLSDRSTDGLIGENEFAKALNSRMQCNYSDIQTRALIACIFPKPNSRLTPVELMKIFEGNSTYGEMREAGT
mmetsp:Transcript_2910/g.11091  ORF Transcript_2910/g.11091 Transcript_2910/m.11091 type:complete len:739 (-) Transcript_2910:132-2348(-)|eukprot:CAMPEP_0117441694 /NCGR_PEP_ID=MMETSP0759-20121206/3765_1 /TAXON_ID=63605 /ORGANISM="Percolomonas cosmopolitus, Strain WS" /LENGTH=738 /DNA_ID=CAMNT_0005233553 /DNA_START=64 /DNA_END=2280 /DNA_ORIENTATION=-